MKPTPVSLNVWSYAIRFGMRGTALRESTRSAIGFGGLGDMQIVTAGHAVLEAGRIAKFNWTVSDLQRTGGGVGP